MQFLIYPIKKKEVQCSDSKGQQNILLVEIFVYTNTIFESIWCANDSENDRASVIIYYSRYFRFRNLIYFITNSFYWWTIDIPLILESVHTKEEPRYWNAAKRC